MPNRPSSTKTEDALIRPLLFVLCVTAFAAVFYAIDSSVEAVDVQTFVRITICGNGIVESGVEVCDEGLGGNLGAYASSSAARTCAPGCETFGPYCSDGILQVRFSEECDDGNETAGDLCDATCLSEPPAPPASSGSPTVGSIPQIPGATPGSILSQTETKVVLRGKAYPGAAINILLDGKIKGTTRADSNATFLYSTSEITPGTATFGFSATDRFGTQSITTSVVFEVVQAAVTTVANIFFPPTIGASQTQIASGDPLTFTGQTVPAAKVVTQIGPGVPITLDAVADALGVWALQVDTRSIQNGAHFAKSYFQESDAIQSGFGRSVSFSIGGASLNGPASPDLNGDGKVNLVDFSIFLLSWNTDNARCDFNADGAVNLADFSIMLFAWTG